MERYTVFLDWKNQYYLCKHAINGNLQIQCNPYQITNGIFYRSRTTTTKNLKTCVETPKILNSKRNPEKEKWTWNSGSPTPDYTIKPQWSISRVLAQRQSYRSVEQDRHPRNKPVQLQSINQWRRRQEHTMEGKRQSLQ